MKETLQFFRCFGVVKLIRQPALDLALKSCSTSFFSFKNTSNCHLTRTFSIHSNLKSLASEREIKRDVSAIKDINKPSTSKDLIIYYGGLTSQIKGVKIFTCTSSIGGLVIQPILLQNLLSGKDIPLTVALGTTVGFFTFVTPFLIHLLTKKYVTEISYNSKTDTYTASTLSFFLRKIDVKFKLEDVTFPTGLPFFTTMFIKGKPVFVASDSFLVMDHYIRIMGYDKPINLKLSMPLDKLEENQVGKT